MDVFEAIRTRRSVRAFAERPLPPEVMMRLKEALRSAPSACNYQPWRFVLVTDEGLRKQLAEACNGQKWMAQAPLTVAAVGLPEQAYKKMGGYGNSVDVDLAIALDHLTLAAVAEGLGTCWIGAFNEGAVKALLKAPADAKVVGLMPVGFPRSADLNHPLRDGQRKDEPEVFSANTFA